MVLKSMISHGAIVNPDYELPELIDTFTVINSHYREVHTGSQDCKAP